jgi:hypothetical protein
LRTVSPVAADEYSKVLDNTVPSNNVNLRNHVEMAAGASQSIAILKQNKVNEVALKSLGFSLARAHGAGQLSDQEREQFNEPLSLLGKFENKGFSAIQGDISPKMRSDLLRLSQLMDKKAKIQIEKEMAGLRQLARSKVGNSRFDKFKLQEDFPKADEMVANYGDIDPTTADSAQAGWRDLGNGVRVRIKPKGQ